MAENLREQLERVRSKASLLVEKYLRLKEVYDAQRKEVVDLKAGMMAKDAEIEKLKMQVEYLSIASTVKLSSDDLQSTRDMVADLVREIDRCITDLSE